MFRAKIILFTGLRRWPLRAGLGLAACSPLPRVLKAAEAGRAVVVEPSPLTAVGETAPFDVTARVPAGHLHKGLAYEVLLRYRYEQGMRDDTLGRISFAVGNYTYDENNRQLLVIRQHFAVPNTPGRSPGRAAGPPPGARTQTPRPHLPGHCRNRGAGQGHGSTPPAARCAKTRPWPCCPNRLPTS